MKRDPALVSLSRDHHEALFVAQRLRRASAETAAEARTRFLAYWQSHGRSHFRLEEEVLLPAYAEYGDAHHELLALTLCDHVAIRQQADALARDPASPVAALHQLGADIATHVRREERELFPLIEQAIPPAHLAAMALALERAESQSPHE